MATYIRTDGTIAEKKPKNGKFFTYKELQEYTAIGDNKMVEIVHLPSGKSMVVNEEGKLLDPVLINEEATKIWKKEYPIDQYPNNNDELIAGNALIVDELELE